MRLFSFRLGARVGPIVVLAVTACGGDPQDEAAVATVPVPSVVVEELRVETVPIYRDFVARTEAVKEIQIEARVEAIVESVEFEEGRRVDEGQVLYRLDPRTYDANLAAAEASLAQAEADLKLAQEQVSVRAAEAGLAEAQANLKKAQQDVARLRPLAEKDAVPRQDLDTALAAEEVAVAQVSAREASLMNSRITEEVGVLVAQARLGAADASVELARLDLEYCTIKSPIEGLIGRTEVDAGNLVGRGGATVLATVSSIDPIYVTFAISEAEYLVIVRRARARGKKEEDHPVELILADDTIYSQMGRIVTLERAVDEQTGTLQIVVEFPNSEGGLRPGQFGRVRLQADRVENAVLVPQRAVMEQQGTKIVFVVEEDDVVALRTITAPERYGDSFIVTRGLEAGERIIVEGQLKARPGSPVRPMAQAVSAEPEGE